MKAKIFYVKISYELSRDAFFELFEIDMKGKVGNRECGISTENFIVSYFLKNREFIDSLIENALYPRKIEMLTPIQRIVLRLCVTEIILGADIPHVIDKWLRITSTFASPRISKFVHGVISDILNELEKVKGVNL